jgi:hypothetical protein
MIEIDMGAVMRCAIQHMDAENDLRWSIGMALEELYADAVIPVQKQMVGCIAREISLGFCLTAESNVLGESINR